MSNWITDRIDDLTSLAQAADAGLTEIEGMSKRGYVGNGRILNSDRSYLYLDDGVLKFYNHVTGDTNTVTIS